MTFTTRGIGSIKLPDPRVRGVSFAYDQGLDARRKSSAGVEIMYRRWRLTSSQTWTAPYTGFYAFSLFGGGGSGGCAYNSSDENDCRAGGGGAGAFVRKTVWLTKGTSIDFTVGLGGTARSRSTTGTSAGNSGGDTEAIIAGVTATAGGGEGGSADNLAAGVSAADGGVASGGDTNLGGAQGGDAPATDSTANHGSNGTGSWGGPGGGRGRTYNEGGGS